MINVADYRVMKSQSEVSLQANERKLPATGALASNYVPLRLLWGTDNTTVSEKK